MVFEIREIRTPPLIKLKHVSGIAFRIVSALCSKNGTTKGIRILKIKINLIISWT